MLITDLKSAIRREALARRDQLPPQVRAAAAELIAAAELPFSLAAGLIVSGFWPMRSEIDPRPLMARLAAGGCRLGLPRIEDGELAFREWRKDDVLEPGGFGTSVPALAAAALAPQIMLVPLAAFDRRGARLGYGKGYYDRAIARFSPALTIGLGFGVQEVKEVPVEAHDQLLDYILTERGYAAGHP